MFYSHDQERFSAKHSSSVDYWFTRTFQSTAGNRLFRNASRPYTVWYTQRCRLLFSREYPNRLELKTRIGRDFVHDNNNNINKTCDRTSPGDDDFVGTFPLSLSRTLTRVRRVRQIYSWLRLEYVHGYYYDDICASCRIFTSTPRNRCGNRFWGFFFHFFFIFHRPRRGFRLSRRCHVRPVAATARANGDSDIYICIHDAHRGRVHVALQTRGGRRCSRRSFLSSSHVSWTRRVFQKIVCVTVRNVQWSKVVVGAEADEKKNTKTKCRAAVPRLKRADRRAAATASVHNTRV